MKNLSDYPQRERVIIVAGIVLVCLGALGFVNGYFAIGWWNMLLGGVVHLVRRLLPIALIALIALIVWASRTGRLHNVFQRSVESGFHRSRYDCRVLGVCGGIARARNVDSTLVRIATILLFIAFPLIVGISYLVLALVMQPE